MPKHVSFLQGSFLASWYAEQNVISLSVAVVTYQNHGGMNKNNEGCPGQDYLCKLIIQVIGQHLRKHGDDIHACSSRACDIFERHHDRSPETAGVGHLVSKWLREEGNIWKTGCGGGRASWVQEGSKDTHAAFERQDGGSGWKSYWDDNHECTWRDNHWQAEYLDESFMGLVIYLLLSDHDSQRADG